VPCRPLRSARGLLRGSLGLCLALSLVPVLAPALACTGTAHDGRADTRTETPLAAQAATPEQPTSPTSTGAGTDTDTDTDSDSDSSSGTTEAERVPPSENIELTFVGDIIFGRFRDDGYDRIPGPDDEPFALIKETLAADIVIGNLETPVVRELPDSSPIGSVFRFGAAADDVDYLVDAGFTALGLANNHAYDMRVEGMILTPKILKEKGLVALGAAREEDPLFRLETIERRGWKIGFIVVTSRRNAPDFDGAPRLPYTTSRDLEEHIAPLIDAAQGSHDAVFVVIHWGDEYEDVPATYQQRYARKLIDRGATAVIGHHPHVLQGIERYKHGVIAYSMGNFLFENTNEIPRLTGVVRLRLSPAERCVDQLTFHPAVIRRYPTPHPEPATKGMGKIVRRRVTDLSKSLNKTTFELEGEDLVLSGFDCPAVPIVPEPPAEEGTGTDSGSDSDSGSGSGSDSEGAAAAEPGVGAPERATAANIAEPR
jgi:poly-gamma-glutamate synthesis protein (capsule biosynthesis protein)